MAKCKKFGEGTLVEDTPDEIVAKIDRKQNKEDRELVTKPARAIAGAAKQMYDAATGKGAKDVEPKRYTKEYADSATIGPATDAVRTPVGGVDAEMRPLNMGKKSKAYKASDFKSGGQARSSASARADGCAIRGKTRA